MKNKRDIILYLHADIDLVIKVYTNINQ